MGHLQLDTRPLICLAKSNTSELPEGPTYCFKGTNDLLFAYFFMHILHPDSSPDTGLPTSCREEGGHSSWEHHLSGWTWTSFCLSPQLFTLAKWEAGDTILPAVAVRVEGSKSYEDLMTGTGISLQRTGDALSLG